MDARGILTDVATEQGWTPGTQIIVLCGFIDEHDLFESFREYLRYRQEEENSYETP